MLEVVVAVPTFRRPRSLARLLDALEKIETTARIVVVVADNDAERHEGHDLCLERRAQGYRWPLEPVIAPERGIAQARNVLVARALSHRGAGFVAMLDDDEWPSPRWLDEFLRVQRQTAADALQGSILFDVASGARSWAAGFDGVRSIRQPTAPVAMLEGAGNLLLTRACLESLEAPWFDPAFGLTGGEDRDFFERLAHAGKRFAWADEARAYTIVPASRTSLTIGPEVVPRTMQSSISTTRLPSCSTSRSISIRPTNVLPRPTPSHRKAPPCWRAIFISAQYASF